jgi:uncharacterized protein (TIGR00299 family) protein
LPGITLIDSQTAGISGDMLLAALIDAGANLQQIQETLKLIPQNYPSCESLHLDAEVITKHGFRARAVHFTISERKGETKAQELVQSTQNITHASNLSGEAKAFALGSIQTLVDVESKLHGVEHSSVHLHEAGSADTLADILGVAAASDSLGIFRGEIYATPVAVGGGRVTFSHGTLSTPVPAVLEIARLRGIPLVGGPEAEELATPTGVAMLSCLAERYLEAYPPMVPEKVGYGAGSKNLAKAPNFLRVIVGHTTSEKFDSERIMLLETNLDDLPGETLGHALQRILESGAMDVWVTPAFFKKSRPGHVLHAICKRDEAQKISEVIVSETGTLGVRFQEWNRFTLQRDIQTIQLKIAGQNFDVRVKFARDRSGKIVRVKTEFEDIRTIAAALSMPVREVSEIVSREAVQSRPRLRDQA